MAAWDSMGYNTDTQPTFLDIWLNFSSTQTHFQFLNVSIDLKTQPSVSKHMGKPFKHSAELFKHLTKLFKQLTKDLQS